MALVKVQIPQVTGDPEALALAYDKDRIWLVQQRLDNATKDAMGTDVRAFFEAKYQPATGWWKISRRVKDQDW